MNSNAQKNKADRLFEEEKYFEASIEYEREIFEASTWENIPVIRYKKALCYKYLHEFDRAIAELQQIYIPDISDTLFYLSSYEHALCLYLAGKSTEALWKIEEYMHQASDTTFHITFIPLKILCLNTSGRWHEAENQFYRFVQLAGVNVVKNNETAGQISALYSKKNLPRIKETKKAENWSRFIPGSGQMYAGSVGEGAINFLMHASILTLSAHQFLNGFYFTGYLAGLGFFNKMYQGGIVRAGHLAQSNTEKQISEFNHQASLLLMNIQREQLNTK